MAPTKRARPAFSPPRPKKATNASASKSSSKTTSSTKPKSRKSTSGSAGVTKKSTGTKSKSKVTDSARRRSKLVSPTPSASDSLDGNSEGNASESEDEQDEGDEDEGDETNLTNRAPDESPEPDFILAEVTHDTTSSTGPPIPLGLIHRILHSHFSEPEKTKISTDARDVVGKYIEVFVREAIMRCAYEKNGESGEASGGWLELEDLEKVAVQLCLDF